MEKLQYGLQDDKLIHIDNVERGLACNCLCPHCKTQLVAKKGEHNLKHFAHYNLVDCNHGTETALHLLAKNIISQNCGVFVPDIPKTEYHLSKHGKIMSFDKAVLEPQLSDNVRGDILLYHDSSPLNVEIRVTHKIDTDKAIELFNLGIATIEIDLSDIKDNFSEELVKQLILSGEKTSLIYSPKCKEIFAKRILGEWKHVSKNSYGTYVKDCPLSRQTAYFVDICGKGGRCECHECTSFWFYGAAASDKELLCLGRAESINFKQIDKILSLQKEENHLIHFKLLMQNGQIIER